MEHNQPIANAAADASDIRLRYDLKGYERCCGITQHGCTRIAHALTVTGPVDLILRHMISAFRLVLNRHPKMRALMSKNSNEPMTCYIQPPFASDAEVKGLVTIIRHQEETEEKRRENLRKLIQDVCNQTVDRTVQYPYFLMAHHVSDFVSDNNDATQQPALGADTSIMTIVLFSDHVFSDGFSGMVVLNDLLVNIRLLAILSQLSQRQHDGVISYGDKCRMDVHQAQLGKQCQELPLRPSMYDQLTGPSTFVKRCMERLITVIGGMMLPRQVRKFQPLLTSRHDLLDIQRRFPFPVNRSYCLMDSGTKENLESALKACRREKVTLHGAIVACILMAHIKAKYRNLDTNNNNNNNNLQPSSKFKINFDLHYNMRHRVKSPFPELTVGYNVHVAGYDRYASRGVVISDRFWDVARCAKRQTDAGWSSLFHRMGLVVCHSHLNITNTKWNVTIPKSVARDVSISNLGRYPYPLVHNVGADLGTIQVEALHFYSSTPHMSYNALLYVTSTDHLGYTLCHKMSDEDGAELFQHVVKFIEAISTIDNDETMLHACKRILQE